MLIARSTLPLAVALLSLATTAQAQAARTIVQPPNHSPAAGVRGAVASGVIRATATFSDGSSADMYAHEVRTAREAGSGMATGREAGTGLATGKRQYQPLLIRKQIDKASPRMMHAMSSGQALRYLKIEFDNKRAIQLSEVTVTRISPVAGKPDMEELLISFASVTVDGAVPKTMALDDWKR
jgi:type VI secretion system Hcp family effector